MSVLLCVRRLLPLPGIDDIDNQANERLNTLEMRAEMYQVLNDRTRVCSKHEGVSPLFSKPKRRQTPGAIIHGHLDCAIPRDRATRSSRQLLPAFAQATILLLFGAGFSGSGWCDDVINIASRRELFVDRYLIESLQNVRLRMHEPRDEGPTLKFDKPWEGPHAGYVTILNDDGRYRMYYRGISQYGPDGSEHERTCYAESTDAITWTKPDVGLYEFAGSKANNIVLADAAPVTHNFCPMIDGKSGVLADERFKALGGTGKSLFAYVSADGLKWKKLRDEPVLTNDQIKFEHSYQFDSQNLAFWSPHENCYVSYFRVVTTHRRIARCTSTDFVNWSDAVMMEQQHVDDSGTSPVPLEHLYTNQTSPYFRAPHIYLAIAARFFPGRKVLTDEQAKAINVNPKYFQDTSDAILMSSRGGGVYDRTFLEGFVRPGIGPQNWVSRTNYPALNLAQTSPIELSLYVNQDYAQPTSHVRRYSLRLDGFASAVAGAKEGQLVTKPFVFSGQALKINFSTSAGGGIRFGLEEVGGSTKQESLEQIGNEIERTVTWQNENAVKVLAGKPVRLRITLKDADLYSLQFTP